MSRTDDARDKYRRLRAQGYSQGKAAKAVGYSEAWGYKLEREERDLQNRQAEAEGGMPKPLGELDGGVKDCLTDFLLFRETFLARRPVAWAADAAMRTVEWLTDRDEETFAVMNMPPGAGKTTLFTLDIPLWLMCGGGHGDPAIGRAIRIMLGSETKHVSKHYVTALRNMLERQRPFWDKVQKRGAEMTLIEAFGRFKPKKTLGEYELWRDDQFVVAQIGELEMYEKEPTAQAASREGGFLGERVDFAAWDDLVTKKNSRNAEVAEEMSSWFEEHAESRIEPGGVLLLVGQRLSNLDLYRNRLDATYVDLSGTQRRVYERVIYPAHNEATCDNGQLSETCTEWDGTTGCLLDGKRLHPHALAKARHKGRYRTVYQQEDSNPEDLLVQEAWIYGGTDSEDYEAEGCLDEDRSFFEWPEASAPLIDVVRVDPSVSKWWAFEWWALETEAPFREWLIWGQRKKMLAGTDSGFLDYNPRDKKHVGEMERLQNLSGDLGHPIRVWVVEQNAAHKYLFQTHAFRTWQHKWPKVAVYAHSTQSNKINDDFGVAALLPQSYKLGLSRLPYAKGIEVRNYVKLKIDELTKYPDYPTDDTVMADWFGKVRRQDILQRAKSVHRTDYNTPSEDLPAYLQGVPPYLGTPDYLGGMRVNA